MKLFDSFFCLYCSLKRQKFAKYGKDKQLTCEPELTSYFLSFQPACLSAHRKFVTKQKTNYRKNGNTKNQSIARGKNISKER
jgi:hypothetical protein